MTTDRRIHEPPGQRRSLPWAEEEYLLINGVRHTYAVSERGCIVNYPGGRTANLADLRKSGRSIVEPKRWRAVDFG